MFDIFNVLFACRGVAAARARESARVSFPSPDIPRESSFPAGPSLSADLADVSPLHVQRAECKINAFYPHQPVQQSSTGPSCSIEQMRRAFGATDRGRRYFPPPAADGVIRHCTLPPEP